MILGGEGKRCSLAVARPSSVVDRSRCHFLQHKRRDQRSPVQLTLYAIGCLPSLPCRRCVKPANGAPRGRNASLVIGSRKKGSKPRKKLLCIALLQTLLQGELTSPAERGRGYDPVYEVRSCVQRATQMRGDEGSKRFSRPASHDHRAWREVGALLPLHRPTGLIHRTLPSHGVHSMTCGVRSENKSPHARLRFTFSEP